MENTIINIESKYIKYRFLYNEQRYVLICLVDEPSEDDEMYLAKEEILEDGTVIIRNIESDEEYIRVEEEFERQMLDLGDEENDG